MGIAPYGSAQLSKGANEMPDGRMKNSEAPFPLPLGMKSASLAGRRIKDL